MPTHLTEDATSRNEPPYRNGPPDPPSHLAAHSRRQLRHPFSARPEFGCPSVRIRKDDWTTLGVEYVDDNLRVRPVKER